MVKWLHNFFYKVSDEEIKITEQKLKKSIEELLAEYQILKTI
jgi:hypothetical protein